MACTTVVEALGYLRLGYTTGKTALHKGAQCQAGTYYRAVFCADISDASALQQQHGTGCAQPCLQMF